MTSKERAYFRGLANTIDPICQVGKNGLNDNLLKQLDDALEARELIKSMQGSNQIYAFVGNTVLYVSNSKVIEFINECDIARLRMDSCISNQELENYLSTKSPLDKCAGINVFDAPFLHLEEGKMSTACGMTIEYLIEMLTKI